MERDGCGKGRPAVLELAELRAALFHIHPSITSPQIGANMLCYSTVAIAFTGKKSSIYKGREKVQDGRREMDDDGLEMV